ncbi:circumsporozoite protein [Streptomyces tropicalis]|uniref:Circumsporozoite protein n=1 Tax=Streptomyces tropicalis TaxID=3034234 RepID=A0ABT6ACU2_9ACTN|nr:circumsporozoite protein [Streptomyces tropicalis]MDF3302151.1 circumsporozoite protein [Streptomyces tropicalis]
MTDSTQGADGRSTPASGAKGPDEMRRQLDEGRGRPGDAAAELAGKADVRGRAKARAADLKDKAGAMTVQLRGSASHAGHRMQETAARAGHRAQERASHAGHQAQERAVHAGHRAHERAVHAGHTVHDRAADAGHTVEESLPGPVRSAVRSCRNDPRPLLIAAGAVAALAAAGVLARRRAGRH